jgi:hypothetical protein
MIRDFVKSILGNHFQQHGYITTARYDEIIAGKASPKKLELSRVTNDQAFRCITRQIVLGIILLTLSGSGWLRWICHQA